LGERDAGKKVGCQGVGKDSCIALVARAEKKTIGRESGLKLMDQLIYFLTSVPIWDTLGEKYLTPQPRTLNVEPLNPGITYCFMSPISPYFINQCLSPSNFKVSVQHQPNSLDFSIVFSIIPDN
jgi:hypothetical protein